MAKKADQNKEEIQNEEIVAKEQVEVPEETSESTEEAVETPEVDEQDEDKPKTAKAGKRSAKAQREADEEEARKEAAKEDKEAPVKPKIVHTPNPKNRHGKNYLSSKELVEEGKLYELPEAIELAKKTSKVKFDASVELHMNLGVDPKQADQMVRSTVVLPAGTGKTIRVAVIAPVDKHAEAKKAGADIVSDEALVETINKGKLDFDTLIATPDMMAKLSKAAKVLGPRGLMPNPKSGTVTANVAQAVEQSKAGKVEFRIDKQAIVHLPVGKVSFDDAKLLDNLTTAIGAIMKAKPSAAKGTYVQAISVTTSMGPGIKIDVTKAIAASNKR